jgi:hypothetical protein
VVQNCRFKANSPRTDRPVRINDRAVAIEDEIILTSNEVDVCDGRAELTRAALEKRETVVILRAIKRRGIDHDNDVESLFGE